MPIITGVCQKCGKYSSWTEDELCGICKEKELKQQTEYNPDIQIYRCPLCGVVFKGAAHACKYKFTIDQELAAKTWSISEETQDKMPTETKVVFQMNMFELAWHEFKKMF
jgi:NMD protein affecting ribosome stability and mRNA decay